jgi:DNA helicase HerA-like ATPase
MKTILGTGIDIRGGKQQELYMNDADRSGHFWCFGTTRVGKTRLLENMLEQDIRKGNSVVVIDPKGDIPLFSKIYQAAKEAGREDDLMLITPIFPQYSIKLNRRSLSDTLSQALRWALSRFFIMSHTKPA